ncbi:MAG TPA: alpha/beta hydrolase [Bacteroidales bacterium]|nr:MAG: hypothetical protein A2X01_14010 [Bacteroidetes bacterium GWF2_35_48]HBX52116.1 alpha/beta hydrolase [Bacteroidales bacterium]
MDIKFKNGTIHFTEKGEGQSLVLLHGFTESLEIWNDFSEFLSKYFRVVCIDLPGHGKSSLIAEIHTMEIMAESVKEVLDFLKIDSCVMIGHSMGGYVTLAFADQNPGLLKGFGLFHSSAAADTDEGTKNRERAIDIIKQNHLNYLASFIPDLFAEENKKIFEQEIEYLVKTAKNMSIEGVVAAQEGMKLRTDKYHVLKNTEVPVLIIAGQKDSRIPFAKVMEQVVLPKEAYLQSLRDAAHMGYLEARYETLHAVFSFTKRAFLI